MKKYSSAQLEDAFREMGISDGQTILIHSSLINIAGLENCPPRLMASEIYNTLRRVVGITGTLVVPCFNFDFCIGKSFDTLSTPSTAMGAFSEFVRCFEGAIRSKHPMQSLAAIGPNAAEICSSDTLSSFSKDGPFSKLLGLNAYGLLLGAPMQSFSMVHLVEEKHKVPYRYYKSFTGEYGASKEIKTYQMYVRDTISNPELDLSKIELLMKKSGLINESSIFKDKVKFFKIEDFVSLVSSKIAANPLWLLKKESI